VESRLERGIWRILRWWWEDGVRLDPGLLDAVRDGAARFAAYLGAASTEVVDLEMDRRTRSALMRTRRKTVRVRAS
jgi:hypothetical protein